jgi:RNA polymerase sigma-70 factor (ECF subfamily)
LPPEDNGDEDEAGNFVPAWLIDASALGPDASLELAEQRGLFRRLVETLPKEKREVFRLVHEMEMSMRDVADELGIPEGTVKSRLYYAKKHLAREWQGLENIE